MQFSAPRHHSATTTIHAPQTFISSFSGLHPMITMKSLLQVFIFLSVTCLARAGSEVSSDVSCELGCKNGGYCTLIDGTLEELTKKVQSGHLIQQCVCQPGFTGTTCETVVEECSLPERKCSNGVDCTQNESGEWGCECSLADSLSPFAGYQCRNPITEYCTGKYDPNVALSFCTNGGRCEADFLAAQVAPGDTAFNQAYEHRGCRCPREFYGPHCEFLKFANDEEEVLPPDSMTPKVKSPSTVVFLSLMSLCLLLFGLLIHKRLRRRARVPREITVEHISTSWGNGYSDARFNGRHVPAAGVYNSRNLHVQAVFEDAVIA